MYSQEKIEAIYGLREAVAEKVRLEVAVDAAPTAESRDALLDATLKVEAQTQHAIEVCHSCGHEHAPSEPHDDPAANVIPVDFEHRERIDN